MPIAIQHGPNQANLGLQAYASGKNEGQFDYMTQLIQLLAEMKAQRRADEELNLNREGLNLNRDQLAQQKELATLDAYMQNPQRFGNSPMGSGSPPLISRRGGTFSRF
jgi:hypothetical protein